MTNVDKLITIYESDPLHFNKYSEKVKDIITDDISKPIGYKPIRRKFDEIKVNRNTIMKEDHS